MSSPEKYTRAIRTTEEVTTRRSGVFYFSIIFGGLMLGGMAAGLLAIAADEKNVLMGIMGSAIIVAAWFLIRAYYRAAPVVEASASGITIKERFHPWSEVRRIQLTGNQPVRIFGAHKMEGASLEFSDDTVVPLIDSMYRNLSEVRVLIQQFVPEKVVAELKEEIPDNPTSTVSTMTEEDLPSPVIRGDAQYITGRPYTNFRAICIWILLLAAVVIGASLAADHEWGVFLLLSFGFTGLYFLLTFSVNYFGLSDSHFFLRNSFIPWKRRSMLLSSIKEIVLTSNNNGNVLRLIYKNFKTKDYYGGSLKGKDWLALMKLITEKGIAVKDENDFKLWMQPEMKKWRRWMLFYLILWITLFSVSYAWVCDVKCSENMLILLKLGWLVLGVLTLIGTMILVARRGAKKMDK